MKKMLFILCALIGFIGSVDGQKIKVKGKKVKVNPISIYWNEEQEYEATCPSNSTGTPVTVVVLANTYSSPISVTTANAIALNAAKTEALALIVCTPDPIVYDNTEQSYTANCPGGTTGDPVEVIKAAGTYQSFISVADANAIALAAATNEAEAALVCTPTPTTYTNTEQSYTAECDAGDIGDPVTVTKLAGTYISSISIADANAKALAAATAEAEAALACTTVYYNTEQFFTATCPSGYTGTSVTVTKAAGTYQSFISVDDANSQALAAAETESNESLECTQIIYYNLEQVYKAKCPEGYTGDSVIVTKADSTYTSLISVEDANTKALNAATAEAIANLSCTLIPPTYTNTEQSFTATCPSGYTGTPVTVTKAAGTYTSSISVNDANAKALSAATAEAQAALSCTVIPTIYSNTQQSYTANCPSGTTGSSVTVIKAAGTYTSTISVADANAKALAAATSEAEAQLNCQTTGFNLSGYPTPPTVATPGGAAPGDTYSINAAATPSSSAPQISMWTKSANTTTASKTTYISYTGENLSTMPANGWVVYDGSSVKNTTSVTNNGRVGAFQLPANSFKFLTAWPENSFGKGTPIYINKTDVWWAESTIVAGQTAKVFGRNLAHDNIPGTNNSYVYLVPTGGGSRTQATVTRVTPYIVEYTVPALSNGSYYVYVHNGHGGDLGYSRTTATIVSSSSHVKYRTWGSTTNVAAPSGTPATNVTNINSAVSSAGSSGNTIQFQSGIYTINGPININNTTKWKGVKDAAGNPLTIIRVSSAFNNAGEGIFNRSGSLSMVMMEDIKFESNNNVVDGSNNSLVDIGTAVNFYSKNCYWDARYVAFSMRMGGGANNIYLENSQFIGGFEEFSGNFYLDGAYQTFIDRCTFKQTNDSESAMQVRYARECWVGNTLIQDLDNSTTDGSGWGKGRIWSANGAQGSNYSNLFENITGQGLGTRMSGTSVPDPNSGEMFLWEGAIAGGMRTVSSATSTTVTLSSTIGGTGAQTLMVIKGKGFGQSRRVISGSNPYTVDEPWAVQPDATSEIIYGPFPRRLVIHNSNLNANGKPYIANATLATASGAVNFYGGVSEGILANNNISGSRSGFTTSPTQHNNSLMDANFYTEALNNNINGVRYPLRLQMEQISMTSTLYPMLIGTNMDGNNITGTVQQTWSGITYVPNIAYLIARSGITYGVPPINGIVFSNNRMNNTNTFNWYQVELGQAPTAIPAGRILQQILYNNF